MFASKFLFFSRCWPHSDLKITTNLPAETVVKNSSASANSVTTATSGPSNGTIGNSSYTGTASTATSTTATLNRTYQQQAAKRMARNKDQVLLAAEKCLQGIHQVLMQQKYEVGVTNTDSVNCTDLDEIFRLASSHGLN